MKKSEKRVEKLTRTKKMLNSVRRADRFAESSSDSHVSSCFAYKLYTILHAVKEAPQWSNGELKEKSKAERTCYIRGSALPAVRVWNMQISLGPSVVKIEDFIPITFKSSRLSNTHGSLFM